MSEYDDPDKLNPTVVRLSKELKDEKANGRWLKKNWRQAQADHQAAEVEVIRITKELDMTKKALSTEQEIAERLQDDLVVKQAQFVRSDMRASGLSKDLHESQNTLGKLEVVEKKYTTDLISVRHSSTTSAAEAKEHVASIAVLKKENLGLKDKLQHAEVDLKKALVNAARCRNSEAESRASCHELARKQAETQKIADENEKHRKDIEDYAHRMRDENETAQNKLKVETEQAHKLEKELKAKSFLVFTEREMSRKAKSELKEETQITLGLRKDKSDAESAVISAARDVHSYESKLKASEVHSTDCEGVIERLTGDNARERKRIDDLKSDVQSLKDDVSKWKAKCHESEERISSLKGDVKAEQEEAVVHRRSAKEAQSTASRVAADVGGLKSTIQSKGKENGRLLEGLDDFRKELEKRNVELEAEKAKVVKLVDEVRVERDHIGELQAIIHEKEIAISFTKELEAEAQRHSKASQLMATEVGRELHVSMRKHKEVSKEIPAITEAGEHALHEAVAYREKLAAAVAANEQLTEEAAENLRRALAAETLNKGHERVVADLEETAAHAKSHDNTASAMTTKMATRLYEAQKKLPLLEEEVASYKDHMERMVGEMNALKEQLPKNEKEVENLSAELQASKAETRQWQRKVEVLEVRVNPMSEKLQVLEMQVKEEQVMKGKVVEDAHRNRKRATEAEEEAAELAKHVTKLVGQLKVEDSDPKSPKSMLSRQKSGLPRRAGAMKGSESLPAIHGAPKAKFGA